MNSIGNLAMRSGCESEAPGVGVTHSGRTDDDDDADNDDEDDDDEEGMNDVWA